MEESSEAHMDTDVPSTTKEVPDTQEVTGSNGNVEMVIVVEKVTEKEVSEESDKQSENNDSALEAPEKPSPMDTTPLVTDQKSPTKDIEPEKSTLPAVTSKEYSKPESMEDNLTNKSPITTEECSSNVIVPEVTEADNKTDKPKVPDENIIEISNDSVEVVLIMPPVEKSTKVVTLNKEDLSLPGDKDKKVCEPDKVNSTNGVEDNKKSESTALNNVVNVDVTVETSNDSQGDANLDISEREHNKSISRELKSLINSAKESKIISECTQLTSKTRKSRTALDVSSASLNTSVEGERIQGMRRNSNNSQKSNCSEKSEKVSLKRSMRSQNPEFVSKVKQFLNSVTGKTSKEDDMSDDEIEEKSQVVMKNDQSVSTTTTPKKRKLEEIVMNKSTKLRSDSYCWRCHWAVEQSSSEKAHAPMLCTVCPRSFHFKCLSGAERNKITSEKSWVCPDCLIVLHAESSETRSHAMKKISLGMLCELLKFALERMMDLNGVEPFMSPVDRSAFPDYDKYVVHPMDLSQMKANIADGQYGSTESFLGDAQWILHNSIIFNTLQSKLTGGARALVRSCRAEMGEIEACPECYAAAHARRPTWFTDVCSSPHILLWAKLKGFPYWPAKGMSVSGAGLVDVRFFGAHDRAWVPAKDCFLYSEKDPNNFRTKRQDILDSMQEAEQHIRNISRKYGKFVYPPFKTQFDPHKLNEQLKMMIPTFEGEIRVPVKQDKSNGSPSLSNDKSRSNSKSSKSSVNDSDISEAEDPLALPQTKKTEGPNNYDEDFSTENHVKIVEVDVVKAKENTETENTKKRPRANLEEAVFTVLDGYITEKRKRTEEEKTNESASTQQTNSEPTKIRGTRERHKSTKDSETLTPSTTKTDSPSSSTPKEKVVAPLKINLAAVKNAKQNAKVPSPTDSPKPSTSNDRSLLIVKNNTPKEEKPVAVRQKQKTEKSVVDKSKEERVKPMRRRNSKSSRSSSGASGSRSSTGSANTLKAEKAGPENKNERLDEPSTSGKDKPKVYVALKSKGVGAERTDKSTGINNTNVGGKGKIDEDTSLAVLSRDTKSSMNNSSGLPTISSVRSLSTTAHNSRTTTTTTNSTNAPKTIEITIEANPDSSIFTPTSTDNIKSIKDAAAKLQKLRGDTEPMVGKVGVRAFARMTSPEKERNNEVQVEIKAEPIDLDDADRHMEKMDLMNAFKLRPVNPPSNLREVRINEVVITPLNRKVATKVPEIRPRAKKTFPHPKKPEDGQLNGKNSMVYIPIQPPMTQAPLRHPRPNNTMPVVSTGPRPAISINNNAGNIVNTVTTPLVPLMSSMASTATTTTTQSVQSVTVPTIGQVPTTVHTVPLMTSVNGQWMFSLQPVMSVGGVDSTPSPPLVNGIAERGATLVQVSPAATAPSAPVVSQQSPVLPIHQSPILPVQQSPVLPVQQPPILPVSVANATPPLVAIAPATSAPSASTATASSASTTTQTSQTEASPPGEPPRLQQRPLLNPLDRNTPVGTLPAPCTAGPLTAKLNQNAVKLTDFFRTLLEDSLEKLDEPSTQVATLRLQLEQTRWKQQQQLEEMKHNHELTVAEMRASFEKEKARAVSEARRLAQLDLEAAVKLAKSKQWCANCSQEAQFYCCWNTSYCDYPCQRAHWTQHFFVCTQKKSQDWIKGKGDGANQQENRLQPQSENLPKSSAASAGGGGGAALTVGGKPAAQRPFAQDSNNAQKTSIIMSMVEDTSGNQTVKCVGTYSTQQGAAPAAPPAAPAAPPASAAPRSAVNVTTLINQQLGGDDGCKKVVTSGGYLIVGASGVTGAGSVSATPNRRMHTIQYFS